MEQHFFGRKLTGMMQKKMRLTQVCRLMKESDEETLEKKPLVSKQNQKLAFNEKSTSNKTQNVASDGIDSGSEKKSATPFEKDSIFSPTSNHFLSRDAHAIDDIPKINIDDFAGLYAKKMHPQDVILLIGEVGAGKTTFVRSLLSQMGIDEVVVSPTFTLIESYQCEKVQIHHLDLYRIKNDFELDELGLVDMLTGNNILLVEWGERFDFFRSHATKLLKLSYGEDEGERNLQCYASD